MQSRAVAGPVATSNSYLNGNYMLNFYGFKDADGSRLIMAGSFLADGSGHISAGFIDINSASGAFSVSPVTGTYTVGTDYRGTLTLNWSGAAFTPIAGSGTPTNAVPPTLPFTFALALAGFSTSTTGCTTSAPCATLARMVGFDDPATGIHSQASLHRQNLTGLPVIPNYTYTFAGAGSDLNGNLLYAGGVFGVNTSGNIVGVGNSPNYFPNAIDMVTGAGGVVSAPISGTLSGSVSFTPSTGRLLLTMIPSAVPSNGIKFPTHYVAYWMGTGNSYLNLMSVDSYDSKNLYPLFWSDTYIQSFAPPASYSTLSGAFTISEKGINLSTSSTTLFSEIGQGSCNSSGVCNLNEGWLFQQGSTALQAIAGLPAGLTVNSLGGNGRVLLTDVDGSSLFLYLNSMGANAVFFEASSVKGKLGIGALGSETLPTPSFTSSKRFAVGETSPLRLTMSDVSGTLMLAPIPGAGVAFLSGSVDHAGVGLVSYGDSFGPWVLQSADVYGISQAVDGGTGNLTGYCVIGGTSSMNCLSNSLDPTGDIPSVLSLNAE
jgi:hypothetical protein